MRKTISLFVLSDTGSSIMQATISRIILCFLSIVVVAFLTVVGIVGYDYFNIKKALLSDYQLESNVADYLCEISNQREQIKQFAVEINSLKSKIVNLNDFEKKIRIIANLEKVDENDNLFGVGGSAPDDLDTQVPVTEKYNSLLREMHDQTDQLKFASHNQQKGFESLLDSLEDKKNFLACTPAIRPTTGWLSSKFGYRKSPFTGKREFHKGLDIATKAGTPIVATANGVITYSGNKGFMGKMIVIDHGHGMVTRYAHIQKLLKKRGESVKRGDVIALVGNTGRSTGPHLHYEVHLNGIPVNPAKYVLN